MIGVGGTLVTLVIVGALGSIPPRRALFACALALAAADAGFALAFGEPVLRVAIGGAIAGALASPRVYAGLGAGYMRPHAFATTLLLNCAAVYLAIS